jgi:nitrate/nitrite transporter NarK
MIPAIIRKELLRVTPRANATERNKQIEMESAAIIGFTSAIAACGAFFIPKSYGTPIAMTDPVEPVFWDSASSTQAASAPTIRRAFVFSARCSRRPRPSE